MNLGIDDFTYNDLYSPARLGDLALTFDRFVEQHDAALFARFDAYRHAVQSRSEHGLSTPEESALLIAVGRELALFLTQLFGIDAEVAALQARTQRESEVARFKKEFVTKRVVKVQNPTPVDDVDPIANEADPEMALAIAANRLLDLEKQSPYEARPALDALAHWTAAQWKAGRFEGWTSFRLPQPLVFDRLVPTEPVDENRFGGDHHEFRRRDGFHLTDERMSTREITDEAHYCIFCHERKKDSCSRGFVQPNGTGVPTYKPNPLGMALEGCPLDEKIGEMNFLRAAGDSIGGLALVMIDNPMCPGTGHRICNDCMRACIFQKQDPVNIPQIETGALTDVLFLPWGFEIYSLLTRWNPLDVRRPMALPYNGKNVLVVGLGPAGYTLAHYLANEGFGVVAIDGLKIEPLEDSRQSAVGGRQEKNPETPD
ncbi:MAG: pyridine nucleotide-disulfide oxidoreductase, partial [Acidobacteriota bacterium]|nr:pyridine nucleotide-disulfide oxidoreductase [Acidobacteriota bacterium]